MLLLLLFIGVPLLEITLFIQVGGVIGLWWTLATVIFTAVLGTWLLRQQGAVAMNDLRRSFGSLQDPTEPLANGAMILFAGALLLTPGFFTDACGFLLLIPGVRSAVFAYVRARVTVQSFSNGPSQQARPSDPTIIDGEFEDITPSTRPTHTPENVTKH